MLNSELNYQISNSGLPVYHVRVPESAICKVKIMTNAGSAHEDPDSWGVAHFLEHMVFQGTATKNKHQVSREQSLVGSYNAYTDYFCTAYHFDSLNEDFETGLQLLKEAVLDSNYPEAEFEKEKSVIVEEWRMYDNYPSVHFDDFIFKVCFGEEEGHPIIGTKYSILSMNPERLHRFRNKWYGKENMFVIVVGNLSFERVMEAVNRILPPANDVEKTKVCLKELQTELGTSHTLTTDRFEQASYGLVYKWPSAKQTIENRFVSNFFQWALHKYMYEYIRDDLGLCYGVGGNVFSHKENSYLGISMLTSNEHINTAANELQTLFTKIKSEGFPDELFQICKKQQLYSKVKALDSVYGIVNAITYGADYTEDPMWFVNEGRKAMDLNWVKSAAERLTKKDLQDFANQWLTESVEFFMITSK